MVTSMTITWCHQGFDDIDNKCFGSEADNRDDGHG